MCGSFIRFLFGTQVVHVCNDDPDLVSVFAVIEVRPPTFECATQYPVVLYVLGSFFGSGKVQLEHVHAKCLEHYIPGRYRDRCA